MIEWIYEHKKIIIITGIVLVVLFVAFFCGFRSGVRTGGGSSSDSTSSSGNVQSTVSRLKDQNQSAGKQVDDAQQHITDSITDIQRADELGDRIEADSERIADTAQKQQGAINRGTELTGDCIQLTKECKSIIADVERANQAGNTPKAHN